MQKLASLLPLPQVLCLHLWDPGQLPSPITKIYPCLEAWGLGGVENGLPFLSCSPDPSTPFTTGMGEPWLGGRCRHSP